MLTRAGSMMAALTTGDVRTTRRDLLVGSSKIAAAGTLAAVLAGRGIRASFAQGTPATGAYPELKVTITDKELQLSATEIPAGYVLLTVANQSKNDDSAGLVGPGPGQTMAQLKQLAATPSPQGPPPFFLAATILGGPGDLQPGQMGQAIIKVPEGEWVVFEEGNLPPVFITAKTGPNSNQTEPQSVLTVTEVDFAFGGFDVPLPAGKQTWKVVNQGKQAHMLIVSGVPAGTTVAQVLALATAENNNASPPAGGLTEQDLKPVNPAGVIFQSPGTAVWPVMDLPAGHYAALCFAPDPEHGGEPHVMEGMLAVFDVGTAGAPAP